MQQQEQEYQEENIEQGELEDSLEDSFEDPIVDNYIPITSEPRLNDKIISVHSSLNIVKLTPIIKKMNVVIPYRKKDKSIYLLNGKPVAKKLHYMEVFMGYESKEYPFPIKKWFTDDVSSSSLRKEDALCIEQLDDLGITLAEKMVSNPTRMQCSGFLNKLRGVKISIAITEGAVGGRRVEMAKTTISKGEQISHQFLADSRKMDELRQRTDKKGLLGIGFLGL